MAPAPRRGLAFVGAHMAQAAFTLACLPYEAFFSLGAILRTAGRMLFTHTRLLEWTASSELDGKSSWRAMWISPPRRSPQPFP